MPDARGRKMVLERVFVLGQSWKLKVAPGPEQRLGIFARPDDASTWSWNICLSFDLELICCVY